MRSNTQPVETVFNVLCGSEGFPKFLDWAQINTTRESLCYKTGGVEWAFSEQEGSNERCYWFALWGM